MIVKSSQREGSKELAKHLNSGENETVCVVGSRGVLNETINGALEEFEAISRGSNCQKHLFHVSISPSPDVHMNNEGWEKTWLLHEEINKLKGHFFIEVEHIKNGRAHRHRVYERVNYETGKAVNLSWTRLKNERLGRTMEVMLGHPITQGKFNKSVIKHLKKSSFKYVAARIEELGIADRSPRVTRYTHYESQQVKRFDLDAARSHIADAWAQSDSPQAFKAALRAQGYELADGDKAGVPVAIDRDGHVIPIQRSINVHRKLGGLPTIKKKEFMQKIKYPLPDLDFVRESQMDKQHLLTSSQQADQKEDLKMQTTAQEVNIPPSGKIKRSKATTIEKQSDKDKLLTAEYGYDFNADLSRFWHVDREGDGSLRLKNKAGVIVDRGDLIEVRTTGEQLPTAAAVVQIAKLKGWDEIEVEGTDEFKKAVYSLSLQNKIKITLVNEHDRLLYAEVKAEYDQRQLEDDNHISVANTISKSIDKNKMDEFMKNIEEEDQKSKEQKKKTGPSNH
ncbi:MAG TPA: hypothetical protein ENJ44_04950 [Oceanospirillales bacterium]|nr:hypothetical protein [Oceanospirillales bacterium]